MMSAGQTDVFALGGIKLATETYSSCDIKDFP